MNEPVTILYRPVGPKEVELITAMNRILFYRVSEPYGEFSNFAAFPVRLMGQMRPTTEHFFQAPKFAGIEEAHVIRKAK